MPIYKYTPYYSYSGPTFSQPFREELSPSEVEKCIAFFFEKLDGHFVGTDAVVDTENRVAATVITSLPEERCDEIVKSLLNYLDLFAHKATQP